MTAMIARPMRSDVKAAENAASVADFRPDPDYKIYATGSQSTCYSKEASYSNYARNGIKPANHNWRTIERTAENDYGE